MIAYICCMECRCDCKCHHVSALRGAGKDLNSFLKTKSAAGQLRARATAVLDGTQSMPPATPATPRVRVAYTCSLPSAHSNVTSYIPSIPYCVCTRYECVHPIVLIVVWVSVAVYTTEAPRPATKRKAVVVDVDEVVLHPSEHRRLSVCRSYIISQITYCIYPMLYDCLHHCRRLYAMDPV